MKKVLIISYSFPPRPDVGGLRPHGLAKYLPEFGWEPIILTTTLPSSPNPRLNVIQTSYHDVVGSWKKRFGLKPEHTIKERFGITSHKNSKTLVDIILIFLCEIIAYPDEMRGWYTFAVEAGDNLLKHEKIDAIISSSKPETCHLVAKELRTRHEIPWVADFRDLWTQNHYYQYSPVRRYREMKLELETLSKANALVTVSKDFAKKLQILHKGKSVYVIPNGFDPEEANFRHPNLTEKFTITYTGVLYQGKRDPSGLFEAIQDLVHNGIMDPRDIEIRFYGPKEDWMRNDIEYYQLRNIVNECGQVPRNSALEKQKESQVLLLLLWDHPEEVGTCPSKIFEYLAAERPILAIGGPPGVVAELLNDTKVGMYARSIDEIKKALKEFYSEYKREDIVNFKGVRTRIDKYSQKEMARRFSAILDKITQ